MTCNGRNGQTYTYMAYNVQQMEKNVRYYVKESNFQTKKVIYVISTSIN